MSRTTRKETVMARVLSTLVLLCSLAGAAQAQYANQYSWQQPQCYPAHERLIYDQRGNQIRVPRCDWRWVPTYQYHPYYGRIIVGQHSAWVQIGYW